MVFMNRKRGKNTVALVLGIVCMFGLISCGPSPANGDLTSGTQQSSLTTADTDVADTSTTETIYEDTEEAHMYNKFLTDGPDSDVVYLTGSTKKDPLSYQVGETITFHISLARGKTIQPCWKFAWTMVTEGGKTERGTADGSKGWFEVSTVLDRPGSVQLSVQAYDDNGNLYDTSYKGGAAANVEQITLAKEEPADFDAFWKEQVQKLDDIGLEVLKYELVKENASFYIYDVRLNAVGNMPVSGYLSIPKNATPGKCKAKLAFQGYSCTGAPMFYEKNTILFSVNIHGIENGRDDAYYQEMSNTVGAGFGFSVDRIGNRDTSDFLYLHLRNLQAVRFVKSFEEWNGEDLIVSGGSCGGMQALALGALDPDISLVSAWIPWLCDVGGYTDGRIKSTFAPDYVEAIGYFDVVSFAKRITCQVGISAGLGDHVIPLSGVLALTNSFVNAEVTGLVFQQHDTHGYVPPMTIDYVYVESDGK